jgi:ribose-phosphate pyrophosphokinase
MSRLLLPLPGNEAFTNTLASEGGFALAAAAVRRFPDGELHVRIDTDVAGRAVDLVCALAHADAHFLTLAFVADALRDLGASEVTLLAPYLGYMRQDARFQPGEAVTSRTFARLLGTVVDRLVTVDPHLHRFAALSDLYRIPCQVVKSAPAIGRWVGSQIAAPLIIGPDSESEPWAAEIAAAAGAPYAVFDKVRLGDREVRMTAPDLAAFAGRQPVLVDDIASSGRTLVAACQTLQALGFAPPVCVVVHAIFVADALDRVRAVCARVVSTDTLPHVTNAISITPLVARALTPESGPKSAPSSD